MVDLLVTTAGGVEEDLIKVCQDLCAETPLTHVSCQWPTLWLKRYITHWVFWKLRVEYGHMMRICCAVLGSHIHGGLPPERRQSAQAGPESCGQLAGAQQQLLRI